MNHWRHSHSNLKNNWMKCKTVKVGEHFLMCYIMPTMLIAYEKRMDTDRPGKKSEAKQKVEQTNTF